MSAPRRDRLFFGLSLGFGALLLLIAGTAVVSLSQTFNIFGDISRAHERHHRIADALGRIRSEVYLAGILKRDFLLDPGRKQEPSYGEQFAELQASTAKHVGTLAELLPEKQRPALAELRSELDLLMRPLAQALDWEPLETAAVRWELLRVQLRQRNQALQFASDIEELNARNLSAQRSEILDAEQRFRRTLLTISVIGVLLALLVAAATMFNMHRLARQSEHVKSELRRLSHQLVKVQEQERKTISRELHDEVGQMLTGLRMELGNLDGPHARGDPAFYQRLLEVKSLAEQSLRSVRNLAMLLRPSMLDDLGLEPAIRWQAREFSRHSGIRVDVQIEGEVDSLPEETRTCLYRVVQEALTNTARHAAAKEIHVRIVRDGKDVRALITDDGKGFSRGKLTTPGLGLLGMEERVMELQGNIEIASHPGQGTRISVRIPVEQGLHETSSAARG